MISPIKIIGSLAYQTREALNNNPDFILGARNYMYNLFSDDRFNLWHYPGTGNEISNILLSFQKSNDSASIKFPALFDFHPILQDFSGNTVTLTYNLAFVAPTRSDWTTEQREKFVFEPILRPMYQEFFNQISKSAKLFQLGFGHISHRMHEVYTTGNNQDEDIKGRYSDYVDAIRIEDLKLTLKPICQRDIDLIEQQNQLVTN